MASVDIVCLANSYKLNRRCIAGLSLDGGGWVRPVSERACGELDYFQYGLPDGDEPKILDVIRVDLSVPRPLPYQPENWRIGAGVWELIERPASAMHAPLVAHWLSLNPLLFGCTEASVPEAQFEKWPAAESLTIIQPAEVGWYTTDFKKPRASFRFRDVYYDLPLTDPAYAGPVRRLGEGCHASAELGIPKDRRILFTISLSEPFHGACYKLVAAVVVLPADWDPFF